MLRNDTLYKSIGNYILCLGVPISIAGYAYLCDAVYLVTQDFTSLYSATKRVYPKVAETYGVSSNSVQKCISNAVHTACRKPNRTLKDVFQDYFCGDTDGQVSPVEFIARVSWNILLENQNTN